MEKRVLAFDFGASSGRAIIGHFDGENIRLEEVHRFSNDPVSVNGTLYWDVLRLFFEIKQGLTKAKLAGGFDSIGIDTWGVDFGLLDEFGCLLENPIHYRDARTAGMIEDVFKTVPREELYSRTGIQFMELNTLFQLCALKKYRPHILDRADKMLFMPDLFAYMLTGRKQTEYSIATGHTTFSTASASRRESSRPLCRRVPKTECSARIYAKSWGSTPLKLSAYADTTRSRR